MQTLKLNINDNVYDKFMLILQRFDKSEIEIVQEDNLFNLNKNYLNFELNKLNADSSELITVEELNNSMDEIISKYEN